MKHCIYMHKFPNGKVYIGQTISGNTRTRWGKRGSPYKGQKVYEAIEEFGWDNIEHIILEDNIPSEEIDDKERAYIDQYDSVRNGYNVSLGGRNIEDGHWLHKEGPLVIHVLNLLGIKDLQSWFDQICDENGIDRKHLTDPDYEVFDLAYELIDEEFKSVNKKSFINYFGNNPGCKFRAETFQKLGGSIFAVARKYDIQEEIGEHVEANDTIKKINEYRAIAKRIFSAIQEDT